MPIEATIETVSSHWIQPDHARGSEPDREELYPVLALTGVPRVGDVSVKFSADRYRYSSDNGRAWTDWRIYLRDVEPASGIGDKARSLIREACEPVVREWLASPSYTESRQAAIAYMIKRQLRDERVSADSAAATLAENEHELSAEERENLTTAVEHLRELLRLT